MKNERKISLMKSVILTSLWSFLLAEAFFWMIYYFLVNFIQWIQIILTSFFVWVETNSGIFNPISIIIFSIWLIIISLVTFLEIATIIAISVYDYYRDDHIPLKSLFFFVWERLKNVLNYRFLPIFLIILFFPKEHIWFSWLYSLEIPPFILTWIFENILYTSLFAVFTLAIIYFVYKSIFVIHIILLEKDENIISAVKKSFALTKQIWFWKMMKIFFSTLYLSLLVDIFIIIIFSLIIFLLFSFFENLWSFSLFIMAIIQFSIKFLIITLPWIIFLATLTVKYIEIQFFSENKFKNTFWFFWDYPDFVKRWKNVRFLLDKFWAKTLAIFSLLFILIFSLFWYFFVSVKKFEIKDVEIIAHRWYLYENWMQVYIENTLKAIENAHKKEADMIEFDVFENKEGNLYVSHDPNLKRIAKVNKNISDMTDAELDSIVLSDWSHIPKIEEILEYWKKNNVKLLIEPKIHWKEKNLYKKVADLIKKYDIYDIAKVHSLSLKTVLEIKKIDPKIQVWYTVFWWIWNIWMIPVDFYSVQETIVSKSLIKNIHTNNKKIYLWTLNSTENLEKYLFMWVDWFITDQVELIRSQIDNLKKAKDREPIYYLELFWYKILIWGS